MRNVVAKLQVAVAVARQAIRAVAEIIVQSAATVAVVALAIITRQLMVAPAVAA